MGAPSGANASQYTTVQDLIAACESKLGGDLSYCYGMSLGVVSAMAKANPGSNLAIMSDRFYIQ